MWGSPVGTRTLTSSTQIIPTNYHGRVFNINFMSAGTSSTVKFFDNGPSGTLRVQEQNTASLPKTADYGVNGYEFANGVYVSLDASVSYVTVQYRYEESN